MIGILESRRKGENDACIICGFDRCSGSYWHNYCVVTEDNEDV